MDYFKGLDGFCENYLGFQGILDNENGDQLVKAVMKTGQKIGNEEKALMALRNHSEAERRRRERINGHLATLKTLIPGTNKMDKAALLGTVINQVKELRRSVSEATNDTLVPTDIDEVKVEEQEDNIVNNGISISIIRASFCCDFKQELISNLKEALEALPLKMIRAEIATLGNRMVSVFVISKRDEGKNVKDEEGGKILVGSVREALNSVLDKFYASEEYSSRNGVSGKRRRSNSSSSLGDHVW